MQAVKITEHGDTDVIEYGEYPDPEVDRDEVLVDIKAAALNHLDVWTRRGLPTLDLEMPHIPGSDGAGVVVETGEDVTRFEEGDHVAVSAGVGDLRMDDPTLDPKFHIIGEHVPGVHSEYTAISEDNLIPVPEHVDWEVAGSSALVFQTAWRMLIDRADLEAGEKVLVLGASGGVGHAALQIADYAGAEVYATGSTEEKLEYAKEHGADYVCNYEEENFAKWVRSETDGAGVDVVVEHVGEPTWRNSLQSLTKGGRLVTCGGTGGGSPETDIPRIFWNQLEIIGSTMATPEQVDEVMDLVWDGTLEPAIREELPMSEIARAHEIIENREGFGKVVVRPDGEL